MAVVKSRMVDDEPKEDLRRRNCEVNKSPMAGSDEDAQERLELAKQFEDGAAILRDLRRGFTKSSQRERNEAMEMKLLEAARKLRARS